MIAALPKPVVDRPALAKAFLAGSEPEVRGRRYAASSSVPQGGDVLRVGGWSEKWSDGGRSSPPRGSPGPSGEQRCRSSDRSTARRPFVLVGTLCETVVKRLDLALESALSARAVSSSWKGRFAAGRRAGGVKRVPGRPWAHSSGGAVTNPIARAAGRRPSASECVARCVGFQTDLRLSSRSPRAKLNGRWLSWRSWFGDARGAAVFSRARAGAAPTSRHAPTARPPRSVPTAPNAFVPSVKAARGLTLLGWR